MSKRTAKMEELQILHAELVAEIVIVKTAHQELGVVISDMRGQLDTLFERMGVEVPSKKYSYEGFKTKETNV